MHKTKLFYHFVLVTKYRKPILEEIEMQFVIETIKSICQEHKYELKEIQGDLKNHVHFVIGLNPTHSISKVIQIIKSKSTVIFWKQFPETRKHYWYKNHLWSRGYFCESVGTVKLETILKYVEHQGK